MNLLLKEKTLLFRKNLSFNQYLEIESNMKKEIVKIKFYK